MCRQMVHILLSPLVHLVLACITAVGLLVVGAMRLFLAAVRPCQRRCSSTTARRIPLAGTPAPAFAAEMHDVDGIATEVLVWQHVKAEAAQPPVVFIFFPGNPGSPYFYSTYLGCIHRQLSTGPAPLTIYCPSHAGHSAATATRRRFSLQQQVVHKIAFVKSVEKLHPGSQLLLGGHSVGSYCAMRCLAELPPAKILRVFCMFPTLIDIQATPNGRKLTPVFEYYRSCAWMLTHVVAALPRPLRQALLRRAIPQLTSPDSHESLAAAESILHADVAANALHMALHEMREICALEDGDEASLRRLEERVVMYFGAEDGWVSQRHADSLSARFKKSTVVRCAEGHEHAFVLNPASCSRLGALTARWIADVLPAALPSPSPPTALS